MCRVGAGQAQQDVLDAGDAAAKKIDGYAQKIADYEVDYVDSDVTGVRRQPFECEGPAFESLRELQLFVCEGHEEVTHDFVYKKDLFGIPLNVTGDGDAGMSANAEASVDSEGIHANVHGQFGANHNATQTFDIFGQDVNVGGDLRLGPSGDAGLDVAQDDQGKWRLKFKGGFSPIVGAGVSADVPIPNPVVDTVNDALNHIPGL